MSDMALEAAMRIAIAKIDNSFHLPIRVSVLLESMPKDNVVELENDRMPCTTKNSANIMPSAL